MDTQHSQPRFLTPPTSGSCARNSGATLSGGNDNSATNLQACTIECDADSQCASGLKCFQRNGYTAIPGCTGSGVSGWDYCYSTTKTTSISNHCTGASTPAMVYAGASGSRWPESDGESTASGNGYIMWK